jgi:hypothetical protein
MSELIPVIVKSKSLGKYSGSTIYLTPELYSYFNEEKSSRGTTLLTDLQNCRLIKGFKHLLETVSIQNPENILVLTSRGTSRSGKYFYVDYEEYRSFSSRIFFPLYRETGLKSAEKFLTENFADVFPKKEVKTPEVSVKTFEKIFPSSIKKFTNTSKGRSKLYQETAETLKGLKQAIKLKKEELNAIEEISRASKITLYKERLKEYQARLPRDLPETKGKTSWQNWIYENNWMFGAVYNQSIQKERVGFDNIPDYIFPSIDGFLDILEIKLPSDEVIEEDRVHPGSWKWSQKCNGAIGQVVNYIHQIEAHSDEIRRRIRERHGIDLRVVKPRSYILIGNSENWPDNKIEGLRKLNHALHSIEIITYNELLKRGQRIIEMYSSGPV